MTCLSLKASVAPQAKLAVADAPLFAEAVCSKGGNLEMISQLPCGQQRIYLEKKKKKERKKKEKVSRMTWNLTMAIVFATIILL
jgi:hypothetical protein